MDRREQLSATIWRNTFISNIIQITSVDDSSNYQRFAKMLPRIPVDYGYDIFRVAEIVD